MVGILKAQDYSKYVNGVKLEVENNVKDGVYKIYLDNKFIGLGTVSENKLKRDLLLLD